MSSKSIVFATYSLKIKDKKDEDKKLSLGKLYKKGSINDESDFLEDLINFFENINISTNDKKLEEKDGIGKEVTHKTFISKKEKIISSDFFCNENRFLYGKMEYGTFGKKFTLINLNTFEKTNINEDKALSQPFYFLFYIPKDQELGILLLENKGNSSIKKILGEWLEKDIFDKDEDSDGYELILKGFLPKEVWKKLIGDAKINYFEYEEFGRISDSANSINKEFKPQKKRFTFGKEKKPKLIKKLKELLKLQNNEKGFIEFGDMIVKNVKIKMEVNGKKRTYYLSGKSGYPYMDIEVSENDFENGYPKFEVVHKKAKEYVEDLGDSLW